MRPRPGGTATTFYALGALAFVLWIALTTTDHPAPSNPDPAPPAAAAPRPDPAPSPHGPYTTVRPPPPGPHGDTRTVPDVDRPHPPHQPGIDADPGDRDRHRTHKLFRHPDHQRDRDRSHLRRLWRWLR